MIASPVGAMRRVVVGSPALLARVGEPATPGDLEGQPCVQFSGLDTGNAWRFSGAGRDWTVAVARPFATNQSVPAVEACAAGLGFGRFLAYQVAPWVASGALRVVLADFEPRAVPVSLVYTETRLMTPRLRRLLEFLKPRLGETLGEVE